jgi:hypothetical protein
MKPKRSLLYLVGLEANFGQPRTRAAQIFKENIMPFVAWQMCKGFNPRKEAAPKLP